MPILTTYSKTDFDRYYASGRWTSDTFTQALRRATQRTPEAIALIHGDRQLTYHQLSELVDSLACGLVSLGIERECVVSVQLPNSIELATTILALARIGAVYNPLNPGYRRSEVETVTTSVKPVAFICQDEYRGFHYPDLVDDIAQRVPSIRHRIVIGQPPSAPSWLTFHDVIVLGRQKRRDLPTPDPDTVFLLGATSGTTGHPKIYIHTANTQLQEATGINKLLSLDATTVFLAMAPMTHRGALMFGLFTSIAAGAKLVIAEAFQPAEVLSLFATHRVSAFMAIPTQVIDLLGEYDTNPTDCSGLRIAVLSGAPVPAELVEQISTQWPSCTPVTGYGMSECGYCTLTRPGDAKEKLLTSGRPALDMEIDIRDADGASMPPEQVGEIHIRGPYVCAGYFDAQQATSDAIDGRGWLASGDLGYVDTDGYLHPVGRLKHVIIRGGLKVHAEEIEFLLSQHPAIAASVVVGVPHQRLGQQACAALVLRPECRVDLHALREFLHGRDVAKFRWPEHIQTFASFPRTPVGKIDRRAIAKECVTRIQGSMNQP